MTDKELVALLYVWTRDAGLPVNKETEGYITAQLQAFKNKKEYSFSDRERQAMAERLVITNASLKKGTD